MPSLSRYISAFLLSAILLVQGCGGGVALVISDSSPRVDFDIVAAVDGRVVPGLQVFPGQAQTLVIRAGQSFVLDSNNPVVYSLVVGGSPIIGSGNLILFGGVSIQETRLTRLQYGASTSAGGFLPAPVPITVYATSVYDTNQVARVDIVITN